MSTPTAHRIQLPATARAATTQPFPQRLGRRARRQHDILIIRNCDTGEVRYVCCPLKSNAARTRTVSVSKDRRWQTAGSQIFYQGA